MDESNLQNDGFCYGIFGGLCFRACHGLYVSGQALRLQNLRS